MWSIERVVEMCFARIEILRRDDIMTAKLVEWEMSVSTQTYESPIRFPYDC